MNVRFLGLALAAGLSLFQAPLQAQDLQAQPADASFHRAYYLERAQGNLTEALALYESVARSQAASAELRAQAKGRAEALREDLASQDLARLMPPGAIVYAESSRPGEALVRLLAQLGLADSLAGAAARGGFALDPEFVRALAGIRGCALALTRLPLEGGEPGGVVVVNAGEMELLRGLLETSVLAQGTPAQPIEGVPTWTVQGRIHVALSARLVIASDARDEIAGVLRRLRGDGEPSLATSAGLQAQLETRGTSPFFCCVHAEPLRPLLRTLLASQAGNPGAALAAASLDLESLESLVARVNVGEEGLALEADLFLAGDHRNLVFNLLRGTTVDPELLERIPAGVAAFATGALNERGPALVPLERNEAGAPVVRGSDLGRELFANLAGFALFVVPGGAPVPSAALLLSSNDPARTEAVLSLFLGLGHVLASGQTLEGETTEIGGAPTRVFRLPPGIPLYLTRHEHALVLSPSEELIEEALEAREGRSVLHDEAFASELGRLGKDTTLALCAHLGRTLAVAQPYLPPESRAELARFAPLLERTVVALETKASNTRLGIGLALHGLPNVSGLVGEALRRQREEAALVVGRARAGDELLARFEALARTPGSEEATAALAREGLERLRGDARGLNNLAWALLTEERFRQRFDDVALACARASDEASASGVWQYLDTLALALFRAGEVAEAVRIGERALQLAPSGTGRDEVAAALARYRAAEGALAQEERGR